jgi:hypothetical protein
MNTVSRNPSEDSAAFYRGGIMSERKHAKNGLLELVK